MSTPQDETLSAIISMAQLGLNCDAEQKDKCLKLIAEWASEAVKDDVLLEGMK
jgi:hypothetical protein